jgi:glycerophosphoryl diester phosphodiesterase
VVSGQWSEEPVGDWRLELNAMQIPPLLLGHRGARAEKSVPENTLASFDLALAQGCDGFEFDVRLTGDGQAVICHDATTRGLVVARSVAQKLALPRLSEVLSRYQTTAFLDIELKVAGLEKIVADMLRDFPPARGFVVSSFLPDVLENIHGLDPAIPLGLICETRSEFSLWPRFPVECVIPHYKLVGQELIANIKRADKKILVWTVNLTADMKRFSKWGVDGIISDHPKRLARALGRSLEKT